MIKRIAAWSGPRNISTAMMRSFDSRGDTFVSDEPMYGNFLKETNINHPLRDKVISSMETKREKLYRYLCKSRPRGYSLWYQKQMTQHILDDDNLAWIKNLQNIFLIRDPKDVILSYIKKFDLEDEKLLGFIQLKRIFDFVRSNIDSHPIVIDSKDILLNPKESLEKLCSSLNIEYADKMLTWEKGYRETDGVWSVHWYDSVIKSTGFHANLQKDQNIPNKYIDIYKKSLKVFNEISDYKLRI